MISAQRTWIQPIGLHLNLGPLVVSWVTAGPQAQCERGLHVRTITRFAYSGQSVRVSGMHSMVGFGCRLGPAIATRGDYGHGTDDASRRNNEA